MDDKQSSLAKSLWEGKAESYSNELLNDDPGYLTELVSLINNVAKSKYSSMTFPSTSHESLIIKTVLGINNERPFLGVTLTPRNQFDFVLWSKIGIQNRTSRCVGLENAWTMFKELIDALLELDRVATGDKI